jgi:hypothetical protein
MKKPAGEREERKVREEGEWGKVIWYRHVGCAKR